MGISDNWLDSSLSGAWVDDEEPISEAYDTSRVIADKSTTIRIVRKGSATFTGEPFGTAQVVRLESISSPADIAGENAVAADQAILVFGYRGHPTITDTDLKRGDWFLLESLQVKVTITDVLLDTRTSLQAIGKASPL